MDQEGGASVGEAALLYRTTGRPGQGTLYSSFASPWNQLSGRDRGQSGKGPRNRPIL